MEKIMYRCTFTNELNKVGDKIDERQYNNLPYDLVGDYKKIEI